MKPSCLRLFPSSPWPAPLWLGPRRPPTAPAPAPAAAQPAAPHPTAPRRDQWRQQHPNVVHPAARRMTQALNLLEAKGYGDFKDFRADGQNFDANVTAHGQPFTVIINPDKSQVTRQS